MSQILVGCDPEVFVKKNGVFRSAYGLIKGDKKNPQKVDRGAVQVDGMALEFNIDPAASEDEFCINVDSVLAQMKAMVPEYEVLAVPVAHFDPAYMKEQPKEALELGCDPDFNAWTNTVFQKPDAVRPMRTAAGHIHIGWTEGQDINDPSHQHNCNIVGKNMDFYVGLGSLMYDNDVERRSMYGRAGCVRYKSYGVEYRTPSNRWLASESLKRWIFRATQACMEATMSGRKMWEEYGDIQAIINDSDVKAAKKIIDKAGLEVCYG